MINWLGLKINILGYLYKKPDFIIAGFSKCGTTGLASILDKHQDIFIHAGQYDDEIMFFNNDRNYKKGYRWYLKHFGNKCSGDKTPSYVYWKYTMRRISRAFPGIKLIFCVRNL